MVNKKTPMPESGGNEVVKQKKGKLSSKYIIITSCALITLIAIVGLIYWIVTANQKLIFEDDFSDKNSGWTHSSGSDEWGGRIYENGGLAIDVKKLLWIRSSNDNLPEIDDFIVETDVKWLTAPPDSSGYYGFDIIESSRNYNYYRYVLDTSDGSYLLNKLDEDEWYYLEKGTVSPAIRNGNQINRMKIARRGPILEFYVNDTLLTTLTDYSFTKGSIDLVVGTFKGENTYAQALFDNFKLYMP